MPSGEPISTPFSAPSTATEVLLGVDLSGVRAIVTGASSGIGFETARALIAAGAEVTLAVRNNDAGAAAADRIEKSTGPIRPRVLRLDLADRQSVARFAETWEGPLHLLVNNAGLVTSGLERTPEGWELQFATNHLGHFALATGLHDALALGAGERDGARIVALSSTAHMRSGIDFGDLHFRRRSYDPQIAYAQSKTANSLFAVEATRRWAADGIVANAVNPGASRPDCSETSRRSSEYRSRRPRPPASSPTRPSNRVPPPASSRPSTRSSLTPEVTTSTTVERPTPCPTTPSSPSIHTG